MKAQTDRTACVDCGTGLVVRETTVASDGHSLICVSCEGKRISMAMASIYRKGGEWGVY